MTLPFNDGLQEAIEAFVVTNHPWITFVPVVTQSGVVAHTANIARYLVRSTKVNIELKMTITGAGTAANGIIISGVVAAIRPTGSTGKSRVVGTGIIWDGAVPYVGSVIYMGADDFRLFTDGRASEVGITPNFALANNDEIGMNITYER